MRSAFYIAAALCAVFLFVSLRDWWKVGLVPASGGSADLNILKLRSAARYTAIAFGFAVGGVLLDLFARGGF
jgi:hypothetical protein